MQVLNMLNWVQVVDHAPCSALSVWKTSLTGLDLPVKKRVRVQGPTCSVLNQEAVLSLEARSVGEFLLVLVSIPRLTECASGVKKLLLNLFTSQQHFSQHGQHSAPAPGGLPPPCCADERYDSMYV